MPAPTASPAALVTTGIDLTDRESPSRDVEGALEADPGDKLAEIGRLATEQRALRRVATLVASEVSPERVFTAVSEGCARVLEVNASTVVRYESDGTATVRRPPQPRQHRRLPRRRAHPGRRGLRARRACGGPRRPARIDDWGGLEGEIADAMFRTGYRSTAAAPIVVGGRALGRGRDRERGPAAARQREPARRVLRARLAGGRERPGARRTSSPRAPASCSAGDEQRRRLERNLHDGAQQRLVSVALMLRLARARLSAADEGAAKLLDDASRELDTGLAELREIARGLHPAVLSDHGLSARSRRSTARLPMPVELDVALEERPPDRTSRRPRTTSPPRR